MDWRRVKTILIIALIVINLLLAYIIFENKQTENSTVIDRSLIIELLTKEGSLFRIIYLTSIKI